MSGHSKWAQIKRQKGVADQKRGSLFTKLANAITVAARTGGDPASNFQLRLAVDKARSVNMPKDNIERAIKRGTGELGGGGLEELSYEGYGPGGTALVIKVLTDNKNRSAPEIKHILSKFGGTLGTPGSVSWQFKEKGVLRLDKKSLIPKTAEQLELQAIDLGAADVLDDGGILVVYTASEDLKKIKDGLEKTGVPVDYAQVELVPDNTVELNEVAKGSLGKLLLALDEQEDVQDYYHNAKI